MKIKQFEIWQVDLNPTKGSEQRGKRPCVILQTNAVSNYGFTTIIAPITSKKIDKIYVFETIIEPSKINNLINISKIKFDQIRTIDKTRLIKKIGDIEKKYYDNIINSLKIIIDINGDFR